MPPHTFTSPVPTPWPSVYEAASNETQQEHEPSKLGTVGIATGVVVGVCFVGLIVAIFVGACRDRRARRRADGH